MRYNKKQESKKFPAGLKDRKQVCRAAALGMAGAVLVLHTGAVSACVRTGGPAIPEGQQDLPVPHLREGAGISMAAREGEKASGNPEQDSILDRWDIDPDSLPREENEEIPPVPEEIRVYFQEAVAGTIEQYKGSTPPAPALSKYSLRADTIRAGIRAKAHALMKKESAQILDRMNSFALSFSGPAIAQMASDLQSRTTGKMAAFGNRQEDDDSGHVVGSAGLFPSSFHGSESSPSAGESSVSGSTVRVPFLSIVPHSKEESQTDNPIEDGLEDSYDIEDSIEDGLEDSYDIEDSIEVNTAAAIENDINVSQRDETENSIDNNIDEVLNDEAESSGEGGSESSGKNGSEYSGEGGSEYSGEDGSESFGEDGSESSGENGKEIQEEALVRPDGEHFTYSTILHAPPGMNSFLSYLPAGNRKPDEEGISSEGDSSGDLNAKVDSPVESHSPEENSSGGPASEVDPAEDGFSDDNSDSRYETEESVSADSDLFPDLTANFALARPLSSGRLYYKYGRKDSQRTDSESEEKEDSGEIEDDLSEGISEAASSSRRNTVFIGDSRTVGMEMFVDGREDEYWCAKNSMGYSWLVDTATPSVENLIGENTDVVILMGVNDLGNVNRYVDYMNAKAAEWKDRGARTFFVSVTPVVDSKSPNAKNSRIESFNAYAIENLRNVHYIDAYNRIRYSFGSPDGIHFDAATYREIYRIIHFYLYQGWYEEAGLSFYFDCGQPLTGWHRLDNIWQYMDGAGVRWVKNSRVGDVCLAPYPMSGLTDPDIRVLSSTGAGNSGKAGED